MSRGEDSTPHKSLTGDKPCASWLLPWGTSGLQALHTYVPVNYRRVSRRYSAHGSSVMPGVQHVPRKPPIFTTTSRLPMTRDASRWLAPLLPRLSFSSSCSRCFSSASAWRSLGFSLHQRHAHVWECHKAHRRWPRTHSSYRGAIAARASPKKRDWAYVSSSASASSTSTLLMSFNAVALPPNTSPSSVMRLPDSCWFICVVVRHT